LPNMQIIRASGIIEGGHVELLGFA